MPLHAFGWDSKPPEMSHAQLVRDLNVALRQLWHDMETRVMFTDATQTITALHTVLLTTTQGKWAYDASNYVTLTVSSAGVGTFDSVSSGTSGFAFSDAVAVNAALTVTRTSGTQLAVQYDGSNHLAVDVSSAGAVTLNATGASAGFTFSDPITVGTLTTTTRLTSPLLGTTTAADVVFDRNSVTQLTLGSLLATFAGDVNVASGKVYKVNGTQVVSAQGATIADASGGVVIDAEARTALNALLARVRTHGLIAT